jgi:hypothetical protein
LPSNIVCAYSVPHVRRIFTEARPKSPQRVQSLLIPGGAPPGSATAKGFEPAQFVERGGVLNPSGVKSTSEGGMSADGRNDGRVLHMLGLMLAHDEATAARRPAPLAVCAWCQKERGEVAQPGQSHGVCERHRAEWFRDLAARREGVAA